MAIPKIIHYCWFGNNPKSELIQRCIESWKEKCPDFVIKEWTEENFKIDAFPFTKRMYEEKRWAFVADYARLEILLNEGGFYLDTDMLLCKSLLPLTAHECVLGEESVGTISAGMIAATPHHPYIQKCKEFYDAHTEELITIPRALTQVFKEFSEQHTLSVLPPRAFYPFDAEHIHHYKGQDLGSEVYGVHLWNYSWGHPLNKFFKKIGVYRVGKRVVEVLGIKTILKKLLGFI
jgi:mannosyltransferase OCH1-like enzyme